MTYFMWPGRALRLVLCSIYWRTEDIVRQVTDKQNAKTNVVPAEHVALGCRQGHVCCLQSMLYLLVISGLFHCRRFLWNRKENTVMWMLHLSSRSQPVCDLWLSIGSCTFCRIFMKFGIGVFFIKVFEWEWVWWKLGQRQPWFTQRRK